MACEVTRHPANKVVNASLEENETTRRVIHSVIHPDRLKTVIGAFSGTWREDVARPKGFEPLTPRFVVWCSIQLSYGRAVGGMLGYSAGCAE